MILQIMHCALGICAGTNSGLVLSRSAGEKGVSLFRVYRQVQAATPGQAVALNSFVHPVHALPSPGTAWPGSKPHLLKPLTCLNYYVIHSITCKAPLISHSERLALTVLTAASPMQGRGLPDAGAATGAPRARGLLPAGGAAAGGCL